MVSVYRRHLAWEAGRKAAMTDRPETANNRFPGTIFYDDWCDGYQAGKREREANGDKV